MAAVQVTVTISATQSQLFPPTTVFGGYRFTVEGMVQDTTELSSVFDFADLAAGDHVALAVAIDASGNPLGTPASATFTVPGDVPVDVPISIDVQVVFV